MIVLNYNGTVVTLRTPTTLPQVTLDTKVSIRFSIDNTLYSYIKTPAEYTHSIEINLFKCPGTDKEKLINFLSKSAGKRFEYIDQKNVKWDVFLVSDTTVLTNAVKSRDTVTLELSGVKS